jgi:hypothetical protein
MSNINSQIISNNGIKYPVFQGKNGKYYTIEGEMYYINVPIEWALNDVVYRKYNIELMDEFINYSIIKSQ